MIPTILVVDDDQSILEILETRLSVAGYATLAAANAETALRLLASHRVDMVISDVRMPGMGGLGLLQEVRKTWPGLPLILLTAYGTIPDAVSAVKDGAVDYLTKPFDGEDLLAKVAQSLGSRRPEPPVLQEAERPQARQPIDRRLWGGRSEAMRRLFGLIDKVAPTSVTVLITGESGTGKEKVARLIHERSPRNKGPFVVVDCGSTPAGLLESELFGHVRGAFTHAMRDKRGLIEEAGGGTLLLDEIGNISQEMQTRLLRFLQERTIRRIGDVKEMPVDCRVLAATNADLPAMVREGSFREDLYYRLKVINLMVPPLRERREDISLLARRFAETFVKDHGLAPVSFSPEAMDMLVHYAWPGNVRELKHVLEATVILCDGGMVTPDDLDLNPLGAMAHVGHLGMDVSLDEPIVAARPWPEDSPMDLSLEESEKRAILRALEQAGWVLKDAADLLGISRRAIHYKVKKYGITVQRRR